ncbi:hypothetical protein HOD29_02555 [archaeon]|jgi:hypothetical protein|nr:hypothetical protein [archaeon]
MRNLISNRLKEKRVRGLNLMFIKRKEEEKIEVYLQEEEKYHVFFRGKWANKIDEPLGKISLLEKGFIEKTERGKSTYHRFYDYKTGIFLCFDERNYFPYMQLMNNLLLIGNEEKDFFVYDLDKKEIIEFPDGKKTHKKIWLTSQGIIVGVEVNDERFFSLETKDWFVFPGEKITFKELRAIPSEDKFSTVLEGEEKTYLI